MAEQETKPLLNSIPQSAKRLGRGLNQTYRAVYAGDIPSVKVLDRLYVPEWFFKQLAEGEPERGANTK